MSDRACETCRHGVSREEWVYCKWGPEVIKKAPDEWCWQWANILGSKSGKPDESEMHEKHMDDEKKWA